MHRIDTPTAQADKFGVGKNGFTGGNPQTGQLPTELDEDFFDAVQEELCSVIEDAGMAPVKGANGQLLAALKLLLQPLNDNLTALAGLAGAADKIAYFTAANTLGLTAMTSVGRSIIGQTAAGNVLTYIGGAPANSPVFTGTPKAPTPAVTVNDTQIATTAFVQAVLGNLGMGSLLPVGVPIPWPTSTPPSGWINCMGQTITQATYSQLYAVYGATLPDMRGLFIRGWDNGFGRDPSRTLLSTQGDAIRNITGAFYNLFDFGSTLNSGVFSSSVSGANRANGVSPLTGTIQKFDASLVVPTASDNRPMNIALNYIVRAA